MTLSDPRSPAAVSLWMDEAFGYLMLFTGDTIADPDRRRRGLAVEPMTAAPDAFNSGDGLLVLDPGRPARRCGGSRPAECLQGGHGVGGPVGGDQQMVVVTPGDDVAADAGIGEGAD